MPTGSIGWPRRFGSTTTTTRCAAGSSARVWNAPPISPTGLFGWRAVRGASVSRVRVLALSPVPYEGAGCRFRIAQYIPHLAAHGIDVTIAPFFDRQFFELVYQPAPHARKTWLFLRQAIGRVVEPCCARSLRRGRDLPRSVARRSAAARRRCCAAPSAPLRLRRRRVPVEHERSEPVDQRAEVSAEDRAHHSKLRPGDRGQRVPRRHSHADSTRRFTSSRRRSTSTSSFPVDSRDGHSNAPITVGWIGTPTTASFLTPLAPVLRALAANTRSSFMSRDRPPRWRSWRADQEPAVVARPRSRALQPVRHRCLSTARR